MNELLQSFLAWLVIFPSLYGIGSLFRRWISLDDIILRGVVYQAVGMGILSYSVVVLSAIGLLKPVTVWILLAGLFLIQLNRLGDLVRWIKMVIQALFLGRSASSKVLAAIFGVSFMVLLSGVLSPELGGDALCYQLNLPKVFLIKGSIAPDYFDLNSYFPMFLNNLYLIGLATGGVPAAKLFHFLCGVLLFLSVRSAVLRLSQNNSFACFFALVVWLTPAIFNMLSTTYVDAGLAFFTFLSLSLLVVAFEVGKGSIFALSGLSMGFALGIKYLAVISLTAFLILWILEAFRERRFSISLRQFFIWGGGASVGCGYWYLRNWFLSGNPVFPYLAGFFGTEVLPETHYGIYGTGKSVWDFISIFWNMLYNPSLFGAFSGRVGGFYFIFVPLMMLGITFVSRSRPYAWFGLSFLIAWFFVSQYDRFLLPVLPALAVSAAAGFAWLWTQMVSRSGAILRRGFAFVGFGLLVGELLAGIYHYRYEYTLGVSSPEKYLRQLERTVPIADWVNQHLPKDAKILFEGEPRQFYFDRPIVRDFFLRYRTHYDQKDLGPAGLHDFLKSFGITHIMINEPVGTERQNGRGSSLRGVLEVPYAEKLVTIQSENMRDARHIYQLYVLT